jgi:hypothetical protein
MTQLVSFADASGDGEVFVNPLQVVSLRADGATQTAIYLADQEEPTTVTGAVSAVAATINGGF